MRHFDAHAYRTEDDAGVWDFARGCIRTYLILREKAQRFHIDVEIQAALETAMVDRLAEPALTSVTPDAIAAMRRGPHDLEAMARRGYGNERLDQLVTELLLGTR
jgi:xylose isomerase